MLAGVSNIKSKTTKQRFVWQVLQKQNLVRIYISRSECCTTSHCDLKTGHNVTCCSTLENASRGQQYSSSIIAMATYHSALFSTVSVFPFQVNRKNQWVHSTGALSFHRTIRNLQSAWPSASAQPLSSVWRCGGVRPPPTQYKTGVRKTGVRS